MSTIKFRNGTTWATIEIPTEPFGKSTSAAAGTTGLVPAPAAGADNRYLRNDGTWQVPPNTNTDTNVTQNHSTTNAEYPILLKNGTGTGNVTSTSLFDGDVTINPSTGIITAPSFKGSLTGNASTATSAATLTTSRNLGVALGTSNTTGAAFNGGGIN